MGYNVWSSHEWRSPLLIGFLLLKGCYGITIGQVHKSICIKKTYTTTHLLSTSSSFWMGRRLKRAQNSASSTFRFHDQNSEQNWEFFNWRILKYIDMSKNAEIIYPTTYIEMSNSFCIHLKEIGRLVIPLFFPNTCSNLMFEISYQIKMIFRK